MACYSLLNCDNVTTATINYAPGGLTLGHVITTDPPLGGPSNCWQVAENIVPCDGTEIIVTSIFDHGPEPTGCSDCTAIVPIRLKNCDETGGIVYIQINYTTTIPLGNVISINPVPPAYAELPNCWEVMPSGTLLPSNYNVTSVTDQGDCPTCLNPPLSCYVLRSCTSGNINYYYTTNPVFATYASLGLTTQIVEHPGCFTVDLVDEFCDCSSAANLTPFGEPGCVCTSIYNCYKLTDCLNPTFEIFTDTNLHPFVGLTVAVAEYPGFCFSVAGISSSAFCAEQIQEPVTCVNICTCNLKCYEFTNCLNPTEIIQVNSNLILALNSVVAPTPAIIPPGGNNCWTVTGINLQPCTPSFGITVTAVVNYGAGNCELCAGPPACYKLTSCDGETIVYSQSDLSGYAGGPSIATTALPGQCWIVTLVPPDGICGTPLVIIPPLSISYCTCPCYKLTNCVTNEIINSNSNLAAYIGQSVHLDEYGGCAGDCWLVALNPPPAKCDFPEFVTVSVECDPCGLCGETCYELVDCVTDIVFLTILNPTVNGINLTTLLTGQAIGQVSVDDVVTNGCWYVRAAENCTTAVAASIFNIYEPNADGTSGCEQCRNSCYGLKNCATLEIDYIIKYTTPNPQGLPNPSTITGVIGNLCFTAPTGCVDGCYQVVRQTDCEDSIDWTTLVSYDEFEYCDDCLPKCYLLTECLPAISTPFIVNNDLSLYVGSVAKICDSDGNCKCYNVELAQTCEGAITIDNANASFTTCEECNSCNCPPGYTRIEDNCQKITSTPAVQSPVVYTTAPGNTNSLYGSSGTRFYSNVTALPFPLTAVGSQFLDAGSVPVPFTSSAVGVWGGPVNSRLNTVGIWTTSTPNPVNEWVGFTQCIEIQETGTYCIGIGGDDAVRLKLDGVVLAIASIAFFDFVYWHVFEVNLTAGTHIIVLEGLNTGGPAAFGAEIYQGTIANLQTITTVPGLQPITVFSTFPFRTAPVSFQTGESSGYSCPPGATLNLCGEPSCTIIETIPYVPCAPTYKVIDCSGLLPDFITNTDLSQYVGGTYKTCIENPKYSTDCYFLQDCNRIAADIYTFTDLSAYVWQTIQLVGYPGSCFVVNGIPEGSLCRDAIEVIINSDTQPCNCPGTQLPWPDGCYCVTVEEVLPPVVANDFIGVFEPKLYDCCEDCTRVCYELIDCNRVLDSVIVCNDLSAYVKPDKVIKIEGCGDICWTVRIAENCDTNLKFSGAITVFDDCTECLPPVPPPPPPYDLHLRKIKPGYNSPNSCYSTDYIEKINCNFADQVYNAMLVKRYGITACCEEDLMTWDIKKQLMDLDLLNDPSMCKSTLCHCPDPCFVSAIITLVPTCVAPYLIRATLDPLCNPPVVTSVEITVESSIPCYCYTVEIGDTPVILGYIDCCCKDVIQVIEEVTTINMCAIYPPVSDVPSSINVTSSGLCSDLCIAPPPVCICWQVTNTGYVAGLSASVTYIPCDSEVATTVIILGETLNVCSYNMPTGDTINVVNNGPCVTNCNTDCQCYLLEFVEPEATFQIYSCKTNTTETAIVNSNGYICSGTVPVPVTPVTGLTITLADPAAIQCNPVTNRCQGVPVVCNCWAIDLEDGQGAIGDCNGIPTNVTNNTGLFGTFYICSVTIPIPAGAYVISPTINALDCSNVASPCNQF